ncbi:fasciclin domain-containing protein [Croceicoccus sp. F390]|uniref:Fasciclin domain-containing protein n=1 Tax=Croceicoccus esteveae TaxID=3075597 RepID=A0ABU2ZE66_9SPHN|nr:fasciclin domain-containing protein [Croceicoccus sp. F390]MDT0574901.1 fasciclin domain-containing protein [Croceicoccus sp. F390]
MKILATATLASATLLLAACGGADETTVAEVPVDTMATDTAVDTNANTVVAVAQGNGDFSTLVSAITAAGLGDTLSGAGPFTVFAPTNAAFDKLPDGTLADLTAPANQADLSSILTYHVVAGDVNAAALLQQIEQGGGEAQLTTVNGQMLTAKTDGTNVTLTDAAGNTATVVQTDVDASNGTIHAIDTVMMPG